MNQHHSLTNSTPSGILLFGYPIPSMPASCATHGIFVLQSTYQTLREHSGVSTHLFCSRLRNFSIDIGVPLSSAIISYTRHVLVLRMQGTQELNIDASKLFQLVPADALSSLSSPASPDLTSSCSSNACPTN
jgi:hypothetical protein